MKAKICSRCKLKECVEKHTYCNDCTKQIHKEKSIKKYINHPYNGYIYIITNPAWNNWLKIGRALNVDRRIDTYNTSSPYRDYKSIYYTKIKDPNMMENFLYDKYGKKNNEWFNISVENAIKTIEEFKEYYNNLIQEL
jgi:hypothetical protein